MNLRFFISSVLYYDFTGAPQERTLSINNLRSFTVYGGTV